jgi:hypothetical protein
MMIGQKGESKAKIHGNSQSGWLQWIVVLSVALNLYLVFLQYGQQGQESGKHVDTGFISHLTDIIANHEKIAKGLVTEIAKLKDATVQQLVHAPQQKESFTSSTPVKRKSLKDIGAIKYDDAGTLRNTDKIHKHGYERFYSRFLEPLRDIDGMHMLEIGFNLGLSYKMWLAYFPEAHVYFMEKDKGSKFAKARFTGDQGSVKDLQRLLDTKDLNSNLDLIIDDGSHHPMHQKVSFKFLFDKGLKPGGIYIVEDIEMNYWLHGESYGLDVAFGKDDPNSIITQFKQLADVVNREFQPIGDKFTSIFGPAIDDWVSSVYFGANCVILTKFTEEEKQIYGNRPYILAKNVTPLNNSKPGMKG